jgi:hypothetical protein
MVAATDLAPMTLVTVTVQPKRRVHMRNPHAIHAARACTCTRQCTGQVLNRTSTEFWQFGQLWKSGVVTHRAVDVGSVLVGIHGESGSVLVLDCCPRLRLLSSS